MRTGGSGKGPVSSSSDSLARGRKVAASTTILASRGCLATPRASARMLWLRFLISIKCFRINAEFFLLPGFSLILATFCERACNFWIESEDMFRCCSRISSIWWKRKVLFFGFDSAMGGNFDGIVGADRSLGFRAFAFFFLLLFLLIFPNGGITSFAPFFNFRSYCF